MRPREQCSWMAFLNDSSSFPIDFGKRMEVSRNRWFTERTSMVTVPSSQTPCRLPNPVILLIIAGVFLSSDRPRTTCRSRIWARGRGRHIAHEAADAVKRQSIGLGETHVEDRVRSVQDPPSESGLIDWRPASRG